MIDTRFVDKKREIIKRAFLKAKKANRFDDYLFFLEKFCFFEYVSNQEFRSNEIEEELLSLTRVYNKHVHFETIKKKIIFYDGFGLSNRGLAKNYLSGLLKNNTVIYLTHKKNCDTAQDLINLVDTNNGKTVFINSAKRKQNINEISSIVSSEKPDIIFFYSKPHDIVGIISICSFSKIKKYYINLTDHAFWAGSTLFDYYLEFRKYGCLISHCCRDIPLNKLILLPYYPFINKESVFQGFPPLLDSNKKIIFSGGDLYKTFSQDCLYYKTIKHILMYDADAVFWYAGSGNTIKIDELKAEFPGRVFFTNERRDLYQIMERCYFYLNTYPLGGGLMMQYAVAASKVPFTFNLDNSINDILINQSTLGIQFKDYDLFLKEIDKCLDSSEYLNAKEKMLANSIISKSQFDTNLNTAICSQTTNFRIKTENIDTSLLRLSYLERLTKFDLMKIVVSKENLFRHTIYYPIEMINLFFLVLVHCFKRNKGV